MSTIDDDVCGVCGDGRVYELLPRDLGVTAGDCLPLAGVLGVLACVFFVFLMGVTSISSPELSVEDSTTSLGGWYSSPTGSRTHTALNSSTKLTQLKYLIHH